MLPIEKLQTIDWFRELPDRIQEQLHRFTKVQSIRKERALYYQNDIAETAFVVVNGEFRVIKWRDNGTTFLVHHAMKADWLGLPETIIGGPYLADAIANTNSEVLSVMQSDIIHLLKIQKIQELLNRELSKGYYRLHELLESHTPESKIAKILIAKLEQTGEKRELTINITQEELARATGLSRETVNKHLHKLQEQRIVNLSRGSIELLKPEHLEIL